MIKTAKQKLKCIATIALLLSAVTVPAGAVKGDESDTIAIYRAVAAVQSSELNTNARQLKAADLTFLVRRVAKEDASAINQKIIAELITLLKSPDIRDWAASALAEIGPKAWRAEAALNIALNDEVRSERGDVMLPPADPIFPLCRALKNIAGQTPEVCRGDRKELKSMVRQ